MRSPKEIAADIRSADQWNPELCAELCEAADMIDEWNAADGENFESVVYSAAKKLHVSIDNSPVLFINDQPAGPVLSYEHNEAFTGWNFWLESGSCIFIPFTNIKNFRSGPILDVATFTGTI